MKGFNFFINNNRCEYNIESEEQDNNPNIKRVTNIAIAMFHHFFHSVKNIIEECSVYTNDPSYLIIETDDGNGNHESILKVRISLDSNQKVILTR
jgi:hypothetical protein